LRLLVGICLNGNSCRKSGIRRWLVTVVWQRIRLQGPADSASLRQYAADVLADIYPAAVKIAAFQTSVPQSTFPVACPFTMKQVMTQEVVGEIHERCSPQNDV